MLGLFDGANRTLRCTCTAINAEIGCDFELAVTFADGVARTNALAAAASNTLVTDFVSHNLSHSFLGYYNYTQQMSICLIFCKGLQKFLTKNFYLCQIWQYDVDCVRSGVCRSATSLAEHDIARLDEKEHIERLRNTL